MSRYMFLVDLDGTLLNDTVTSEINEYSKRVLRSVIEAGHIVCIVTGRPWRSTQDIYEELGLTTIVANYNGAYIHNPTDPNFIPKIKDLMLNDILYIKGDAKIRERVENFVIEGLNWLQVEHEDCVLNSLLAADRAQKYRVGIDYTNIPLKPISALFDIRVTAHEVHDFQKYLRARYSDIADFPVWSKSDNPDVYTLAIAPLGVSKAIALSLMMRYYDIPHSNVLTFGDAYNDIEILQNTLISVAMANAEERVKNIAVFVSEYTNREGAVGRFIEDFLKDPDSYIEKALELHRQRNVDESIYN